MVIPCQLLPTFVDVSGVGYFFHLDGRSEDLDGRSKLVFGPGVPVTYFLDKRGEIIHKHIGAFLSKAQLYASVEKYFEVKL